MSVMLISAVMRNDVIGKDNGLVWSDPEDMKRFRRLTTGKTVLMGRKTWESLPEKFRPLPNRLNAVITRQADYALPQGVRRFASVEQAILDLSMLGDVCVIGGGSIYEAAMPFADTLEITHIDAEREGDVRFPRIGDPEWEVTAIDHPPITRAENFRFVTYVRRDTPRP